MKINELRKVPMNRNGRINQNGVKNEPEEVDTFQYLALFGFNIEVIKPILTKNHYNADILMSGTVWEVKCPKSSNRNTLRIHFKKASKQANKVVFDLRNIVQDDTKVEKYLIELFRGNSRVNRMIIIRKSGRLFDIYK